MSKAKSNGVSGASILGIGMFLVFLILKLAEIGVVANWSWWWVTAPLWMPLVLVIGILVIFLIIQILIVAFSRK